MAKIRSFLSCSFQPEDKGIVCFFNNLLEEYFEVATAEPEDHTDIPGKIFPKIQASQIHFVIFSRRDKIEGQDAWTLPPDILIESGYALAVGRRVFGFVESGIDERQQGLLRFSSTNYPRFERNKLEANRTEFKNYIKAIVRDLNKEIIHPFAYRYVTKEVTIYNNGYGLVRNQYTIEFSKNQSGVIAKHFVGAGRSVKKGYALPQLAELLSCGPMARRQSKPFLRTAIIKGDVSDEAVGVEENGYSEKGIKFKIKIPGNFNYSSLLTYEWCVGCPYFIP